MREKFSAYFIFLRYIWKENKIFFLVKFIESLILGIIPVLDTLFMKYMMDSLTINKNLNLFIVVIFLAVFLKFFSDIILALCSYFILIITKKINISISNDTLNKIYNMSFKFYDMPDSYDVINRAFEYATNNGTQMLSSILKLFTCLITMLSFFTLLSSISFTIVIILFVIWIVELFLSKIINESTYLYKKDVSITHRKGDHFKDLLLNREFAKEIKMNNAIKIVSEKFTSLKNTYINKMKKVNKKIIPIQQLRNFLGYLALFFTLLILGIKFFKNIITVGDFTMGMNISQKFRDLLSEMIDSISLLHSNHLESKNYIEFLSLVKRENGKENPFKNTDKCKIEIKNIYFKYPTQEEYVFEDFSLTIESGNKIAIVGFNGSGKTTLIKLILNLYEVEKGEILINGINVKDVNLISYYEKISTVFQDFRLIQGATIKDNITLLNNNCEDDKIYNLIEKFNLSKEKEILNSEYSKLFDTQGVELSGGEAQRLALLRAILKQGNLIILDESSSALDILSENMFFNKILEKSDKTIIVISHRLSIISQCDNILFLENGKILESGTHNELVEKDGYYNNFLKVDSME